MQFFKLLAAISLLGVVTALPVGEIIYIHTRHLANTNIDQRVPVSRRRKLKLILRSASSSDERRRRRSVRLHLRLILRSASSSDERRRRRRSARLHLRLILRSVSSSNSCIPTPIAVPLPAIGWIDPWIEVAAL